MRRMKVTYVLNEYLTNRIHLAQASIPAKPTPADLEEGEKFAKEHLLARFPNIDPDLGLIGILQANTTGDISWVVSE